MLSKKEIKQKIQKLINYRKDHIKYLKEYSKYSKKDLMLKRVTSFGVLRELIERFKDFLDDSDYCSLRNQVIIGDKK